MNDLADRLLTVLRWPADWPREWPAGVLAALGVLLATWVISWLVGHVAIRVLGRMAARTETDLDDRILAIVDRPMRRLIQVIGVYFAIGALPLAERAEVFATGVVLVVGVFMIVRVATQVVVVLIYAYGKRIDGESDRFQKDYVPLLSKVVGTVLVMMGLVAVLHHFGQNVTSVVAALGVGGVAIGFAAKETLGNMIAGFAILVDRPFRPGDRIKLATGEVGDVLEVGTRSTRLRLLDGNLLVAPNAELTNTRVINFNFPTHSVRAAVDVLVAYGTDVDAAKSLILGIISEQAEVLTDPAPAVILASFGDSGLLLSTGFTLSQFADTSKVQDRVRSQIYKRFQEAGIKIPYPTRQILQAAMPKS